MKNCKVTGLEYAGCSPVCEHRDDGTKAKINNIISCITSSNLSIEEKASLIEFMRGLDTDNHDAWIPVSEDSEDLPEEGAYVLLSFKNATMPDIGRYNADEDGGAFYPGDDDKSYVQYGIFVNAWRPLPKLYREEGQEEL